MTRPELRALLVSTAARSLPTVLVAVAIVAVLGVGTAGALCKYELNCRHSGIDDAKLLKHLQQESRGSPRGTFPPGFRETVVARGFHLPTDFAFVPGGGFLVAEKEGLVDRVLPNGSKRVVLDLRRRIDTFDYRGIITVAVSPGFTRDHRFYVLYVPKPVRGAPDATTVVRFSSFTLPPGAARAGHERVLLGSVRAVSCSKLAATADCIASDLDHDGGELTFGPDGSIFLATGDGGGYDDRVEPSALESQNPDSLDGKVLHITPTGEGLPGNPWWNGNPHANRSKVWAVGFRNPFRIALDPQSGRLVVGDVGRHLYEELDVVVKGGNYGWPCFEANVRAGGYEKTALCRAAYERPPSAFRAPLVALRHPAANSIVAGGAAPAAFPAAYHGTFLYADWVRGWIRSVNLDSGESPASRTLATNLPGPVALHVGPDGRLYYLALNSGDLRRVDPP